VCCENKYHVSFLIFAGFAETLVKKMSSTSKHTEFPLEALKVQGPAYLKAALTSCTDPLKAIEEFQVNF